MIQNRIVSDVVSEIPHNSGRCSVHSPELSHKHLKVTRTPMFSESIFSVISVYC